MCERWGFECKCKRCILELSLKADLEPITTRFQELHEKSLEEISAARSQEIFDANLPACTEFVKLFDETEDIIRNFALLEAHEEKNWIRASFVSTYVVGIEWNKFFIVPSAQEVMDSIQDTVLGGIRTFVIVDQKLEEAKHWMGDESQAFIAQCELAREACFKVFGRHGEDVSKALVLQHSNYHREDMIIPDLEDARQGDIFEIEVALKL